MLSARRVVSAALLTIAVAGAGSGTASADNGVECKPRDLYCNVNAEDPGTSSHGHDSDPADHEASPAQRTCELDGKKVPCTDPDLGWFNNADGCYWERLDPQPKPGSVAFETAAGQDPPKDWNPADTGAFYNRTCPGNPLDGGSYFSATDPRGAAVDPAALARQAVKKMTLRGADIGITPKPGGKGVVGMPVYLWTATGAETYGPNTATASAGAVTVTATANVSKIVWGMGDDHLVTCTTAGTPYRAEFGKQPSPDCGYHYTKPSSVTPSGKYHVTATSTWTINWRGGGQSGQLTETRTSDVHITVAEVQVLN